MRPMEDQRLDSSGRGGRLFRSRLTLPAAMSLLAALSLAPLQAWAMDDVSTESGDRIELARATPLDIEDLADRTGGAALPLSGAEASGYDRMAVILWDENKRAKTSGTTPASAPQVTVTVNGRVIQ